MKLKLRRTPREPDLPNRYALETNTVADFLARSGQFRYMSDRQVAVFVQNYTTVLECMRDNNLWGRVIWDKRHDCRLSVADIIMNVLHFVYLETEEDIVDALAFYNFINDYFMESQSLMLSDMSECANKILKILNEDNNETE